MNDHDITKQLRVAAPIARCHMDENDVAGWPIRFLLLEAAAEIDELRQQVGKYRKAFADLAKLGGVWATIEGTNE